MSNEVFPAGTKVRVENTDGGFEIGDDASHYLVTHLLGRTGTVIRDEFGTELPNVEVRFGDRSEGDEVEEQWFFYPSELSIVNEGEDAN